MKKESSLLIIYKSRIFIFCKACCALEGWSKLYFIYDIMNFNWGMLVVKLNKCIHWSNRKGGMEGDVTMHSVFASCSAPSDCCSSIAFHVPVITRHLCPASVSITGGYLQSALQIPWAMWGIDWQIILPASLSDTDGLIFPCNFRCLLSPINYLQLIWEMVYLSSLVVVNVGVFYRSVNMIGFDARVRGKFRVCELVWETGAITKTLIKVGIEWHRSVNLRIGRSWLCRMIEIFEDLKTPCYRF